MVYVNVGNLPPAAAENHVRKIKEEFSGLMELLKKDKKFMMFIPNRGGRTRVEYTDLSN
jgi:hypothetical protein